MSSSDEEPIICSVIFECRDRLVDELCCEKVTEVLYTNGFISREVHKAIQRGRSNVAKNKELVKGLEESRNDEALEVLIQHLRREGTQPHLWTLLEYSRAKHKRRRASLTPLSVTLHM